MNFFEKMLSKSNTCKILQIFWIIELYFLMANSLNDIISKSSNSKSLLNYFPIQVDKYNNIILNYMNEWNLFILFLALILLLSSIFIMWVKFIPKISDYDIIKIYSAYGVYAFIWLILIFVTYRIFYFNKTIFIFIIPFVAVLLNLNKRR